MQFELEAEASDDLNVTIYGVSTDDIDSHWKFAETHDVSFDLLADPKGEVCAASTSNGTTLDGRSERRLSMQMGAVIEVFEAVNPDGHARDWLLELDEPGGYRSESLRACFTTPGLVPGCAD